MNELVDYSISKNYGQALFELADDAGALDGSFEELCFVNEVIDSDLEFSSFLRAPFVPVADKIRVINKSFGDKISELVLNFLSVLIKNNRVNELDGVKDYYLVRLDESKGVLHAEVTVDREITEETEKELVKKLESGTGKKIKLEKKVDPSILGGIIINCHGKVVDNSVKGALKRAIRHIKEIK